MKKIFTTALVAILPVLMLAQGWPANYDGVMLQGFYWDSYDDSQWSALEKQANDLATSFDLIWIPQSGNCGGTSMGYDDLYWFTNYNSSFGNEKQLRSMINTFKAKGLGTIADVVINHRRNFSSWTDFPAETYNGVTYQLTYNDICSNDEAAKNGYQVGPNKDTGEGWDGMRDLDHKSENVQTNVKAYLKFLLNDLGYAGFRYDMVKGYAAEYTKLYNEDSQPQFSVGEYWDSSSKIKTWIDGTDKTSAAFDFQFKYVVRNATDKQDWSYLKKQNDGNWPLVSTNFEQGAYRQYAVTFVENHDTEVRKDGSSNGPLKKDTIAANAFMLAMPGTPCVFLKHWQDYKSEIKAMIEARKLAGIANTSKYAIDGNPTSTIKTHFAFITDDKLYTVIGNTSKVTPDATKWTKILSGYHYAYYLANTLETAWADQGSGDFTDAFDVNLIAVSASSDAKLVYTTDGSEPTASNGTKVDTGSSIKIDKTTTLKVGLLVGSTVSGIITRVFTYKEKEEEPEVVIPDFCKVEENEVCAFFEAPAAWDNTIYCWAWCDSPAENFTSASGTWPGVACTYLGEANNGNKVWKWSWDGTKQKNTSATQPQKIIFSNHGAPQTDDLAFANGGYYNKNGLQGQVTATGIRAIDADVQGVTKVYTLDGRLVKTAPNNADALSGMAKGIYIVNKRKFIVK
jgi:alpha-amylase